MIKFVNKEKVKLIRLPVQSKNPIIILFNTIALIFIILYYDISIVHARSRAQPGLAYLPQKLLEENLLQHSMVLTISIIDLKNFIIL